MYQNQPISDVISTQPTAPQMSQSSDQEDYTGLPNQSNAPAGSSSTDGNIEFFSLTKIICQHFGIIHSILEPPTYEEALSRNQDVFKPKYAMFKRTTSYSSAE